MAWICLSTVAFRPSEIEVKGVGPGTLRLDLELLRPDEGVESVPLKRPLVVLPHSSRGFISIVFGCIGHDLM
jgi:hypothetical protein